MSSASGRITGYPEIWLDPDSGLLKTVDVEVTSTLTAWMTSLLIAQVHDWSGLLNKREIILRVTSAVLG